MKEVFLAVMGTTPAVLTECLYYYFSPYYKKKRFFSEIKVLTTVEGRRRLIDKILTDRIILKLEKALELPEGTIPFSQKDIIVFQKLGGGGELDDLLTTEDNNAASYLINNWVKYYTDNNNLRLTATVAGGRKTQSALMALAFQLYGRREDELIHIIVPSEIVKREDWYFPQQPNSPEEKLSVSSVPIIKVGRYLLNSVDYPVEKLMEKIQSNLVAKGPIRKIIIMKNIFSIDGIEIKIAPREASYYRYFLRRRKNSKCSSKCEGCAQCCANQNQLLSDSRTLILDEHKIISGEYNGHYLRTREKRINTHDSILVASLYEEISRLNSAIRSNNRSIGNKEKLLLTKIFLLPNNRKEVSIGICIDPEAIVFED